MKCKRPTVWKAICKKCGYEICRFISKPPEKWIDGPCQDHQMCYKGGKFSNFFYNFLVKHPICQVMMCPGNMCDNDKDFDLVEVEWTNEDAIRFFLELNDATTKVYEATKAMGQIRKYIDSGKISKDSFNLMYENIQAIMVAMNNLSKERFSVGYMKKEVVDDIEF